MRATLHAQDDDALLARLRAGDDLAFGALVDRHRPWLVRLCTRLLGYDVHAAEDAAQESLLKLHAAARRDGRPLRVRPWLAVVARNTCVDQQRRRRVDLPGDLPERAAPGEDPGPVDAVLTEAWNRLSGRHREALYLREVLGFSYKEIGAVMELSMPATETLVFRARAALRREYERCGGSAVGYGVLGFRLARLGLGRRRADVAIADNLSRATLNDGGFAGLSGRLAQWASALPGCGEQVTAKVLSMAAGVAMAAASVLPGLGSVADVPAAAAAVPPVVTAVSAAAGSVRATTATAATATPTATATATAEPSTLKALLGNAVPGDWQPHRTRPASNGPAAGTGPGPGTTALTPVRDAAGAARSGDRPTLRRPAQGGTGTGRLRSGLPGRPVSTGGPVPAHPLRSRLTDPPAVPLPAPVADPWPSDPVAVPTGLADRLPGGPVPTDPVPAGAPLAVLPPAPESAPPITRAAAAVKGYLPLG